MSKAKKRRNQKELEKLQRRDNHLEWLAKAQAQTLTPGLHSRIDQAWQEVQRRTLRSRQSFEDFCYKIEEIVKVPNTPDLIFLLSLKAVFAGDAGTTAKLFSITGLSPAHQAAQQALSAADTTPVSWREGEELLSLFAKEPEKISKRHFQDLGHCFANTSLRQPLLRLAEPMNTFRKLNHKTNLGKVLPERLLEELDSADHLLFSVVKKLPEELRKLILLPFAVQVILHFRHCAKKSVQDSRVLIDMVHRSLELGVNHLLREEQKAQVFNRRGNISREKMVARMERDFAAADLETRLILLRDLRHGYSRELAENDDDHFFPEPDNEEYLWWLERMLLTFHRQILKDLGRLLTNRPLRERRDLAEIIAPILAEDIEKLQDPVHSEALIDLLSLAGSMELFHPRLAVMACVLSLKVTGRQLAGLAVNAIKNGPMPISADLKWAFSAHSPVLMRSPLFVEAILAKIADDENLTTEFGENFAMQVIGDITLQSTLTPMASKPSSPLAPPQISKTFLSQATVEDLIALAGRSPSLPLLARFIPHFPRGVLETEGLRRWFELEWQASADGADFLETALALVTIADGTQQMLRQSQWPHIHMLPQLTDTSLLVLRCLYDFLEDDTTDFRRLSDHSLERLVNDLLPHFLDKFHSTSVVEKIYRALAVRTFTGGDNLDELSRYLDRWLKKTTNIERKLTRSLKNLPKKPRR